MKSVTLQLGGAVPLHRVGRWLDIDNNAAEDSLPGICLGCKNWLLCGSDQGGSAAAVHFSLLAPCKRYGHDP